MAFHHIPTKKKRIYIKFRYNNRECNEPSDYYCEKDGKKDCKCRSCKAAAQLCAEIDRKIKEKTFNFAEYFPNSKALEKLIPPTIEEVKKEYTFKEYWQKWYNEKIGIVKDNSLNKFRSNSGYSIKVLGDLPINEIKHEHVAKLINFLTKKGLAPKTIKSIKDDIASVFKLAIINEEISKNPCQNVKTPKIPKTDPYPFSLHEIKQILTLAYDSLQEKGYNPINQLVGYLLSEDPTYITTHRGARTMICRLDRDELLRTLVQTYLGV